MFKINSIGLLFNNESKKVVWTSVFFELLLADLLLFRLHLTVVVMVEVEVAWCDYWPLLIK